MKKSLIAVGVVVLVALALPIIGNTLMQNSINEKVAELENYGVISQNVSSQNNYLSTTMHFEFLLKDADAFIAYLNTYADNKIPPYVNAMFEGVVIGVDLEYSNLILNDSLLVDIYPMKLSVSMQNTLKNENPDLHKYITNFLEKKGLLYHIDYDVAAKEFDGYLKNIDEKQIIDTQTQLQISVQDLKFQGEGELLAPQKLETSLDKFELSLQKEQENFLFTLKELESKSKYLSKSTYDSHLDIEKLDFFVKTQEDEMAFNLVNAVFDASSDTEEKTAEIESKTSIEAFSFSSKTLKIELKDSKLDLGFYELDKLSYEGFLEIIAKMNQTDAMMEPLLMQEMQKSLGTLLSKGLEFKVNDFSVKSILLDESDNLDGFTMQTKMKLKSDPDFAQKLEVSPLLLASNIEVNSQIKVSKKLYDFALEEDKKELVRKYLNEEVGDYVFDIVYKDGEVTINDKLLR